MHVETTYPRQLATHHSTVRDGSPAAPTNNGYFNATVLRWLHVAM